MIRMKPLMHRQLSRIAREKGKSLNEICTDALDELLNPSRGLELSQGDSTAKLVREIRELWPGDLVGILLFGSIARGTETAESDIDLLIVLRREAVLTRALYREWDEWMQEREGENYGKFSPQFVRLPGEDDSASSLWLEVSLDGIVLWEKDFVVSRFLSGLRRRIAGDEFSRRQAHGQGYWRIK